MFAQAHDAADCCVNGPLQLNRTQGIASPCGCEQLCRDHPSCRYLSHAASFGVCALCTGCKLRTRGPGAAVRVTRIESAPAASTSDDLVRDLVGANRQLAALASSPDDLVDAPLDDE